MHLVAIVTIKWKNKSLIGESKRDRERETLKRTMAASEASSLMVIHVINMPLKYRIFDVHI